jgi:hypothetical protein
VRESATKRCGDPPDPALFPVVIAVVRPMSTVNSV